MSWSVKKKIKIKKIFDNDSPRASDDIEHYILGDLFPSRKVPIQCRWCVAVCIYESTNDMYNNSDIVM